MVRHTEERALGNRREGAGCLARRPPAHFRRADDPDDGVSASFVCSGGVARSGARLACRSTANFGRADDADDGVSAVSFGEVCSGARSEPYAEATPAAPAARSEPYAEATPAAPAARAAAAAAAARKGQGAAPKGQGGARQIINS
jgi:hypothetical protein